MRKYIYGNSLPLNRCNEQEDLGILFTPDLKFSQHINKIACKENTVIGIIKRSFNCIDKTMFNTLYVAKFSLSTFRICFQDLESTFNRRHRSFRESAETCY